MMKKFTKENVVKVFVDYFYQVDFESCSELSDSIAEIYHLDDNTEKVVVPKVVAEWIEGNKEMEVSLQTLLKCYANFYRGELDIFSSEWLKAVQWYVENPYKFIRAYEEGYTITSL